jgi:hypothetical protein
MPAAMATLDKPQFILASPPTIVGGLFRFGAAAPPSRIGAGHEIDDRSTMSCFGELVDLERVGVGATG